MTRGLSALPETAHELHGLQVAYGTVVQWQLENRPAVFMDEMRAFYRRIGLPMNLRQLGLPREPTAADIDTIATLTLTAPHMRNFDRPLTAQDVAQAMRAVEAMN
jgi:glycerol dehydrogenase